VADPLDVQETPVGREADLPQRRKVLQPSTDGEVARVIGRDLGPKRLPLLVVRLDPAALVVDVPDGVTPSVISRVRKRPGVRRGTRR
jgi:hypothetical protein